jgi:hypothetical protein
VSRQLPRSEDALVPVGSAVVDSIHHVLDLREVALDTPAKPGWQVDLSLSDQE